MEPTQARETAFARALRAALKQTGLSQRDAAKATGISHTTIGRYLAGAQPGVERAARIANALGFTLAEIGDTARPQDRSPELVRLSDQIREAAAQQARIAQILLAVAADVARLGAGAPGGSETG